MGERAGRTITVLIVEDERMNRDLLVAVLRANGYATLVAADGEEGVKLAQAERPDLILMDIQMPKMDGMQATRVLKEDPSTRGIPVVAVTAFAMQEDEERIRRAGCDAYLTKPVAIDDLVEVVRRFVTP